MHRNPKEDVAIKTDYPGYMADLQQSAGKLGKEIPGPMAGFGSLQKSALADGASPRSSKN
jgi:hypothetical protein